MCLDVLRTHDSLLFCLFRISLIFALTSFSEHFKAQNSCIYNCFNCGAGVSSKKCHQQLFPLLLFNWDFSCESFCHREGKKRQKKKISTALPWVSPLKYDWQVLNQLVRVEKITVCWPLRSIKQSKDYYWRNTSFGLDFSPLKPRASYSKWGRKRRFLCSVNFSQNSIQNIIFSMYFR